MSDCEICKGSHCPGSHVPGRKLIEMTFDGRSVLLCTGHARIAENAGVRTLEELRALYGSGRRSYLPRRSRMPIALPHARPRSPGRRAADLTR